MEEVKSVERNHGNIQEVFLNNARKNRSPIIVYLISGFQMRGIVKSFDNFVVLLESDGKESMIYKHAISTISPI
ncbi:MAG: RNA chaperone Hfq [Clostridia bacterium]|nr:RNA chaperone Hfq [Clostridia bacterium]